MKTSTALYSLFVCASAVGKVRVPLQEETRLPSDSLFREEFESERKAEFSKENVSALIMREDKRPADATGRCSEEKEKAL